MRDVTFESGPAGFGRVLVLGMELVLDVLPTATPNMVQSSQKFPEKRFHICHNSDYDACRSACSRLHHHESCTSGKTVVAYRYKIPRLLSEAWIG